MEKGEVELEPEGLVWPIEARTIDEAMEILARRGEITNRRIVSREELERLYGKRPA